MSTIALHSSQGSCQGASCQTASSQAKDWKDLYVAALMEGDENRVPSLIFAAEHAIKERARELFGAVGDNVQEEEALDDALYALHALKGCLAIHGRFAEAA
jgi:hypothetical protein